MRSIVFPISSLFFAIALMCVGYGLLMSLVGIRLQEFGNSDFVTGLVNASFFFGAILSSLSALKVISSVGHIRSFGVFAALLTFASLGHILTQNPLIWALFRALAGYSFYSMLLIIESWINEKTGSGDRSKVLSIYTVVFYLATSSGQLMLQVEDATGLLLFVLASMFIVLSLIPIAMTKIQEPHLHKVDRMSVPQLYGIAKLALVASFAGGILVGGFFTMAPVYAKNMGLSNASISMFMSIALLGALLSQWPIGWISDRLGRKIAILGVGFMSLVASLLLWIFDGQLLFLGAFLLGISIFAIYPLSLARANDTTDVEVSAVEISRTLLMTYGIGSFLAPVLIGASMNFLGNGGMFLLFSGVSLALCGYTLLRDKVPFEERSIYVPVPSASGDILPEFDPRQDEEWVQEQKEHIAEESWNSLGNEESTDRETPDNSHNPL
ncbi:MFS transporter [Sulfurospirillum sp. T05]|uniref:MFS transporter n=1 Tax=Sulfurospirillum tamanense TaxID=2813362 RepID=A0ABS2WTQ2_9BACT|nr:MFS transporter [Sulfurospirillum tamanensis]MBN2965041.1 MFS transporter [Sulfurospirillum tamanensis]